MRLRLAKILTTLAVFTAIQFSASADSQGRLKIPTGGRELQRRATFESDGAKLEFDKGDFSVAYTTTYVAPPSIAATKVKWDVSRVPGANAVIFEVSLSAFSPDRDPSTRPRAIVSASRMEGKTGSTQVSVGKIAAEAGYQAPSSEGPRRLSQPDPKRDFLRRGGQFLIHLRVVPVASTSDPVPVGLASPELRVIFANNPPPNIKIPPSVSPSQRKNPSPVEFLGLKYVPVKHYCFVHPNPSVCAKVGQAKPWYEQTISFVMDAWDWTCEAYQSAKKAVVDVACAAIPFVPREAFEYALDGALAACGLPPNIPNLDQLMEGGADYLAGEIVAQVGPPVASDLAKEQIKKALISGAKAAANKLGNAGPETPCQYTIDWPYMVVTIRNKGNQPVGPLWLNATDWTGTYATNDWDGRLFKSYGQAISHLSPGAPLPVYVPLMPSMKQKKHYVQGVHKESVYWQDYNTLMTQVSISISASYDPSVDSLGIQSGKRPFNKPFEQK